MLSITGLQQAQELLISRQEISAAEISRLGDNYNKEELLEIAALQDASLLSRADLWNALSRSTALNLNPECRRSLGRFFYYDNSTNTENVERIFRSTRYVNGQVASVEITPHNLNSNLAPILFVGGLNHPTRVYFEAMRKLALHTQRRVIVMDSPGMGGSENISRSSVGPRDLRASVIAVINDLQNRNLLPLHDHKNHISLMGHSLGTVPLRDLYQDRNALPNNLQIDNCVLVTPVPTVEDQAMGYRLNSSFAAEFSLRTLLNEGEVPAIQPHLFFNQHDSEDTRFIQRVLRSEYLPSHIISTLCVFINVYATPLLRQMSQDPTLRLVFPSHDRLMTLENASHWQGRGIHHIAGADHSFLAGKEISDAHISALAATLQETSNTNLPNLRQLYRQWISDSLAQARTSLAQPGLLGRWARRVGLYENSYIGIYSSSGLEGSAARNRAARNNLLAGNVFSEIGIEGMKLPLQTGLGIYAGTSNERRFDFGFRYYLRLNFEFLRCDFRLDFNPFRRQLNHSFYLATPSASFGF